MKCRACKVRVATTWWGWSNGGKLLKAAFCPQCRRGIKEKMVTLGPATDSESADGKSQSIEDIESGLKERGIDVERVKRTVIDLVRIHPLV